MGFLKKVVNALSPRTPAFTSPQQSSLPHMRPAPAQIAGRQIPQDVLDLLWFWDGPYRNCPRQQEQTMLRVGNITATITYSMQQEPSVISLAYPVTKPQSSASIPELPYYPSYEQLLPEQRWIYLSWLANIEYEIDPGYVFIFYYGLERHLFFGQVEPAFHMVMRLRKKHHNSSFLSYSTAALVTAAMLHKRADLFLAFLDTVKHDQMLCVPNVYLMAKYALGFGLDASDIAAISHEIGFTNQRYLKHEAPLFSQHLERIIQDEYGQYQVSLKNFPIEHWPLKKQCVSANYSLEEKYRWIALPCIFEYLPFRERMSGLLQAAHEAVKLELRKSRKAGSGNTDITTPEQQIRHEPDKVFRASRIFVAVNTTQFDKNVAYYNQGICPCCGKALTRRPSSHMKCSTCGNTVYVKTNVFTKEQALFCKQDVERLSKLIDERIRRNWIYRLLREERIDEEQIATLQKAGISIEKALVVLTSQHITSHCAKDEMGLARNSMMHLGNIYEREGEPLEALKQYFRVSYYDLNGGTNSGGISARFNMEYAFLAPGIIGWIVKLIMDLGLQEDNVHQLFLEEATQIRQQDMPVTPEGAWLQLAQALFSPEANAARDPLQ